MTKYVVICYALHERRIASYHVFDSEREAASFLAKDAKKAYEEESKNGDVSLIETVSYGVAELSSSDGKYVWTWEIISV